MKWRAIILGVLFAAMASAQSAGQAKVQPESERRPAPGWELRDSAGKKVNLKQYRGKIVLLDFWATWCHGCKEEIPWFAEFERKYAGKGLRVIGVSLDGDGWKVVRPFLAGADVPYRVLLGDDAVAKQYGIENMPDTFLIDRRGRIAASYVGMVDRANVEENIRAMLARK
jgi:cytochrome c biogenesis protein CcmG/thiol:disulfide interchange protein DsbE